MKPTGGINVTKFSRQDYIYVSAFALSSFLQAVLTTIQGPSFAILFQTNSTQGNGTIPDNSTPPKVDPTTGIVIPQYVTPSDGTSDFSATFFGFLFGFYQLFSFILIPIIGVYVEDFGMKKTYMYGIYVSGISPFLSIFVSLFTPNSALSIIFSFIVRGIEAVGSVGIQVAIYMMITVLFPGRVATIFALNQAMAVFGLALGGPIVFFIKIIGGFAVPSTTFLIMGLIFLGFIYMLQRILPDLPPRDSLNVTLKELIKRFYHFLIIPPILLFEFSIVITGIGNAFLQSILAPGLKELNVNTWGVALIPLLPALLQLLSPVWGYSLDHIKKGELVTLIGSVIAVSSLFIIGPVPFIPLNQNLGLTCFGLICFGLGQGAIVVSSYVLLIALAAENDVPDDIVTTSIISLSYVAAISLGSGLSSILSGIFYDNYGFQAATLFPFSLYALLATLVIIYSAFNHRNYVRFLRMRKQEKEEKAEVSPLLG